MGRLPLKAALWRWTKVGLVLVALDLVLFRAGLFWPLTAGLDAPTVSGWPVVYRVARVLETAVPTPGTALIVGSSVVLLGVVEPTANAAARVPARLTKLALFGASATDSALLAWSARRLHPWLVIYGAAPRDFGRELERDESPVARLYYDASVTLPALPRHDAEDIAAAWVKRGWQLYRYQPLARAAVESGAREWLAHLGFATPAQAAEPPVAPAALPPEARRWFGPFDAMTPERFARWQRWRETRRFDDYTAYLASRGIDLTKALGGYNAANLDLADNPQVESLRWMLATLPRLGARVVVVAFPENPVFRETAEGRALADPALSDASAAMLGREAAAHGARFVDLRALLPADDFHDALHVNLEGNAALSARIGELVAEEWRAR
jgi:hypothetical protein